MILSVGSFCCSAEDGDMTESSKTTRAVYLLIILPSV